MLEKGVRDSTRHSSDSSSLQVGGFRASLPGKIFRNVIQRNAATLPSPSKSAGGTLSECFLIQRSDKTDAVIYFWLSSKLIKAWKSVLHTLSLFTRGCKVGVNPPKKVHGTQFFGRKCYHVRCGDFFVGDDMKEREKVFDVSTGSKSCF